MRRLRIGSLSHWDTAWPLSLETVTGPASMIRGDSAPAAVLPDLQASGEPPAVACATRMKALEQEVLLLRLLHALAGPCNSQGLDCVARKFRKVSFQKYPQQPAFTRRGPGHTLTPYQTDDDTERQLVHTLRLAPSHAVVFIISICCL